MVEVQPDRGTAAPLGAAEALDSVHRSQDCRNYWAYLSDHGVLASTITPGKRCSLILGMGQPLTFRAISLDRCLFPGCKIKLYLLVALFSPPPCRLSVILRGDGSFLTSQHRCNLHIVFRHISGATHSFDGFTRHDNIDNFRV